MTSPAPATCPNCGAPLAPDAPEGLCARCLFAALAVPTEGATGVRTSPPPSLDAVASAFPHLEILALIGAGGMGAVFQARQPKLDRMVALKILPKLLNDDPTFAARFAREGQLLARLSHPNIVTVHDFGQTGGFTWLLMEYVEGVNLREAMRASRFTAAQALSIVPRICEALQYAHDEGVLHRDIKPENILLDLKGRVKLADFGIAKFAAEAEAATPDRPAGDVALTHAGAALGTPQYMAPEQRDTPSEVDHRADIYSLGVVFYELLTGELPQGNFAPPSAKSTVDPRVDAIVTQALEKERERRQHSAGEVRAQVETLGEAQAGKPAGTSQAWVALVVAGLSGLAGALLQAAPGLTEDRRRFLLWLTLAAACAAIGIALRTRKAPLSRTALWVGAANLLLWLLLCVAGLVAFHPSPPKPRPRPEPATPVTRQSAIALLAPAEMPPRGTVAAWLRAIRADQHEAAFALALPGSPASWSVELKKLLERESFRMLHQLGTAEVAMVYSDPVNDDSSRRMIYTTHLTHRGGQWLIDQADLREEPAALARVDGFASHPGVAWSVERAELAGRWGVNVCGGTMTLREDGTGTVRTSDPSGTVGPATDFRWDVHGSEISLPWPGGSASGTLQRVESHHFQILYAGEHGLSAERERSAPHCFELRMMEEQASGITARYRMRNAAGETGWHIVHEEPVLDDSAVASATSARDMAGKPLLSVTLNEAGTKRYRDLIEPLTGRPVAILLNGELTALLPVPPLGAGRSITFGGNFTPREAADAAVALSPGQ